MNQAPAVAEFYRYLVEAVGPRPFMQVIVAEAFSEAEARAAVIRYLQADGADVSGVDEEETAIVQREDLPTESFRPKNEFGVVAASGRIWCDENL